MKSIGKLLLVVVIVGVVGPLAVVAEDIVITKADLGRTGTLFGDFDRRNESGDWQPYKSILVQGWKRNKQGISVKWGGRLIIYLKAYNEERSKEITTGVNPNGFYRKSLKNLSEKLRNGTIDKVTYTRQKGRR